MSQFTFYQSSDASAPALTGASGSLIALLDAILVTGYGSQAAAGWTHTFATTSNIAMYTPGSGSGRILRVQDDASLTGGARDTIIRGVESATALSTFTNAYPTVAQQASGLNWRKSLTADSTARPWRAFADSRTLYLLIQSGDTGATTQWPLFQFGDIYSYVPSDTYNSLLLGAIGTTAGTFNFETNGSYNGDFHSGPTGSGTTQPGHYIDRLSTGTGSSSLICKKGNVGLGSTSISTTNILSGGLVLPNTSDGALYIHPLWIMDCTTPDVVRGEMRGCYHICHPVTSFGDLDTFSGVGYYIGRTFTVVKTTPSGGMWCFETSNTLNTN